jgi:hypothetical protein
VYFTDAAGNQSVTRTDYIHYGQPTLINTTKGSSFTGSITLKYTSYGSEGGTNYYRAYYSSTPTGTKYYLGESDDTSTFTLSGLTPGQLYYLHILMRNTQAGTSDRYSNYMIGFSSDITVVYDDDDSVDIAKANEIKNFLTWTDFPASYSQISGTMPTWTVTLVPEDEVSNSWTTTDDRYIIYGDPVIITPGTYMSSYPNKVRNIVHRSARLDGAAPTTAVPVRKIWSPFPYPGYWIYVSDYVSGVFAMGYGGAYFLDTVESHWVSWGYPTSGLTDTTQYPTEIGMGESSVSSSADQYAYHWTFNASTAWNTPLTSTSFTDSNSDGYPDHNTLAYLTYSSAPLGGTGNNYRVMAYRPNYAHPVNGQNLVHEYANGDATTYYFPVVRQGRFMQYGFPYMMNRPYTGKVLFANLMALMDNY